MIVPQSPDSGTQNEHSSLNASADLDTADQPFLDRISKITNTIEWIAEQYADGVDFESQDILQDIYLELFIRSLNEDMFLDQNNSYITMYSKWQTLNRKSRIKTYRSHVSSIEDVYISEDEDERHWEDFVPGETLNPEEQMCRRESLSELFQEIFQLSPENHQILTMIFMGYQIQEIAEIVGISSPAVSQRKLTIAKQLRRFATDEATYYQIEPDQDLDMGLAGELFSMISTIRPKKFTVFFLGVWGENE